MDYFVEGLKRLLCGRSACHYWELESNEQAEEPGLKWQPNPESEG